MQLNQKRACFVATKTTTVRSAVKYDTKCKCSILAANGIYLCDVGASNLLTADNAGYIIGSVENRLILAS